MSDQETIDALAFVIRRGFALSADDADFARAILAEIREGKAPGCFYHPSRDLMQALTDVDDLRAQLDAMTKERDEARAAVAGYRNAIEEARESESEAHRVIARVQTERDEARAQRGALGMRLGEAEAERDEARAKLAEVESKLSNAKGELAAMTDARNNLSLACETFQHASEVACADATKAEAQRDEAVAALGQIRALLLPFKLYGDGLSQAVAYRVADAFLARVGGGSDAKEAKP